VNEYVRVGKLCSRLRYYRAASNQIVLCSRRATLAPSRWTGEQPRPTPRPAA
jgi:hypothetical protein